MTSDPGPSGTPYPDATEPAAIALGASGTAPLDASDLGEVVGRAPMHRHDRVPAALLRLQGAFTDLFEADRRRTIAIVVVLIALFTATAIASARILVEIAHELDLIAFAGLFLVNWLGNGGGLVPIPGARYLGLLMIFQQAVVLPAAEVWVIGGTAMALGLVSYYLAGARSAALYNSGEQEKAIESVADLSPTPPASGGRRHQLRERVSHSWAEARRRAQPLIENHGIAGMSLLCFVPWPLATGGAFLGGAMGFGFLRFLAVSFAAKLTLSGVIVLAALVVAGVAKALV
jgi:hypothetical protein